MASCRAVHAAGEVSASWARRCTRKGDFTSIWQRRRFGAALVARGDGGGGETDVGVLCVRTTSWRQWLRMRPRQVMSAGSAFASLSEKWRRKGAPHSGARSHLDGWLPNPTCLAHPYSNCNVISLAHSPWPRRTSPPWDRLLSPHESRRAQPRQGRGLEAGSSRGGELPGRARAWAQAPHRGRRRAPRVLVPYRF